MEQDSKGMRGNRSRNDSGVLRRKRGDTHISTVEEQHGVDFVVRSDMHLETLLRQRGAASLNDLLHNARVRSPKSESGEP